MPNRATRRRTMKTAELREQAIEAMKQTPYIDLEADNDPNVVVRVWHPLLVDDDTQKRIAAHESSRDIDKDEDGKVKFPFTINGEPADPAHIRFARAVLGEDEHKRFVDAGGHSNDVQLAWVELQTVHEEADDVLGNTEDIEAEDPK